MCWPEQLQVINHRQSGCTLPDLSLFLVKMAWMGAETLEGPVHEEAGLLIRVPPSFNVLPSFDAMIDVCMLARDLAMQTD